MTETRATWAAWKRDAKCDCTDPDPAACTSSCEPSPQYTRECPCHYLTNRTPAPAPRLPQCPTCGLTPTEPHPRQPGARCANCKTHATAVCSGEEGFCAVHGYDRHPTAPDGLREQYMAAIIRGGGCVDLAAATDAVLAVRDAELLRLRAETATADQIRADVQRERDRLREELAASDETARRLLERHQELAAERYVWQERGLKAEATIERMKRTNRMVNGSARDARERAETAEATVEHVRAECDRIEAAVRANPQDPDFDGAYLAAIGHVRNALDPKDPS